MRNSKKKPSSIDSTSSLCGIINIWLFVIFMKFIKLAFFFYITD